MGFLDDIRRYIGGAGNEIKQHVVNPVQQSFQRIQMPSVNFSKLPSRVNNYVAVQSVRGLPSAFGDYTNQLVNDQRTILPYLNTSKDTNLMQTGLKKAANFGSGVINRVATEGILKPTYDLGYGIQSNALGQNIDRNSFKSGAFRTGANLAGGGTNLQTSLGDLGQTVSPILESYGAGKVFGFGGQAMNATARTFPQIAKQSSKTVGNISLLGGLAEGAQQNRENTLGGALLNTGMAGAGAYVAGRGLGLAMPYAGREAGRIVGDLKQAIKPSTIHNPLQKYVNTSPLVTSDGNYPKMINPEYFQPKSFLFKGAQKLDERGVSAGMSIKNVGKKPSKVETPIQGRKDVEAGNRAVTPKQKTFAANVIKNKAFKNEQITTDQANAMIGEAAYKHSTEPQTFQNIYKTWVGKKEAAKTRGYLEGSKAQQGGEELIKEIENGIVSPKTARFKAQTDQLYKQAKEAGVDMGYLDNYITHIWEQPQEEVAQIYAQSRGKFGFSKERKLPTYEEGIKLGLTPKYGDTRQIIAEYAQKLHESIANVEMVNSLKKEGLLLPASVGSKQLGFSPITAPGIGQSISKGADGATVIGQYYAPDEIAQTINRVFSPQDSGKLGKFLGATAKVSGTIQDVTLSGGIPKTAVNSFGLANATKEILSGRIVAPLKSMIRSSSGVYSKKFAQENVGQIIKMQERGIPVNTELDVASLGENGFLQKALTGGDVGAWNTTKSVWNKTINEPTFKRFMPQLQIHLFNDIEKKALQSGKTAQEAADLAAGAVKNFYGITGLEKTSQRNQLGKDALATVFFAPRYRESMINFWVKNLKSLGKPTTGDHATNAKFMLGALALYGGYDYLNYNINGKHLYENPDNKTDKLLIPIGNDRTIGVPYLSSIATMPRLAMRTISNVAKGDLKTAASDIVQTSASQLIKPTIDVLANSDYFGNEITKETDTAGEKFKKIGAYLVGSYNHPYIKAALTSIGNDKPGYQIASEAMELPIRFYKTSSIEKGYFWDKLKKLETVGDKFTQLKKEDKDKAREFYNKNEDALLELAQLRNVANVYGKLKKDGDIDGANKLTQEVGKKIDALTKVDTKLGIPTANASTNATQGKLTKGEIELAKLDFADSDSNFKDLGSVVLRKTADGTVVPISKIKYNTELTTAKMTQALASKDNLTWMKLAQQQYKNLTEQLNDPSVDELDKVELQNKLNALIKKAASVKKGKKGKKPKAMPKLKFANIQSKNINVTVGGQSRSKKLTLKDLYNKKK